MRGDRLCDDPNVDVVYNTTPWALHVPVQLAAMNCGKHVFTEVPSAFTVDECWELVEMSERTTIRRPQCSFITITSHRAHES